jgi:hypothetical protein
MSMLHLVDGLLKILAIRLNKYAFSQGGLKNFKLHARGVPSTSLEKLSIDHRRRGLTGLARVPEARLPARVFRLELAFSLPLV